VVWRRETSGKQRKLNYRRANWRKKVRGEHRAENGDEEKGCLGYILGSAKGTCSVLARPGEPAVTAGKREVSARSNCLRTPFALGQADVPKNAAA